MEEYPNGGVVNEEDLPPIIPLHCPIRVLTKVFAIVHFFYPLFLHFPLLLSFIPALHVH